MRYQVDAWLHEQLSVLFFLFSKCDYTIGWCVGVAANISVIAVVLMTSSISNLTFVNKKQNTDNSLGSQGSV